MYYYDDSYAVGALIAALVIWPIVIIVFYVLGSLGLKKIFEKAGVAQPNVAWIPVYSLLVLAKLADINPWLYLIYIGAEVVFSWVPVLNFIIGLAGLAITIGLVLRTNQKLSKEPVGFTIFGVILFPIWVLVVGYGQTAPWKTGEGVLARPFWHSWGTFFQDTTTWSSIPSQGYPVTARPTPPAPPAPPAPPTAPPTEPPAPTA